MELRSKVWHDGTAYQWEAWVEFDGERQDEQWGDAYSQVLAVELVATALRGMSKTWEVAC